MNFRLAVMQDLPRLKAMYEDIIQNMNNNQIQIWDDIYRKRPIRGCIEISGCCM